MVCLAAGLGAVARYVADMLVEHRTRSPFPLGTFAVNVTGSFFLGLVTGMALHHGLGPYTTLVLGTGFAGGYTTMSTWAWESVALTAEHAPVLAALNVVGSFAVTFAAAAAGLGLMLL
jgi:CrcB protein